MRAQIVGSNKLVGSGVPARGGRIRDWQRWAPYAAVAWSLLYGTLGLYWAVSGRGFPNGIKLVSDDSMSVVGQLGPVVAWTVVIAAGFPAAVMGTIMLRGVRVLRPLFITAGVLLAGILLLLMTDLGMLAMLGYIPFIIFRLFTGTEIGHYVEAFAQWTVVCIAHASQRAHQADLQAFCGLKGRAGFFQGDVRSNDQWGANHRIGVEEVQVGDEGFLELFRTGRGFFSMGSMVKQYPTDCMRS